MNCAIFSGGEDLGCPAFMPVVHKLSYFFLMVVKIWVAQHLCEFCIN
jgi:hypothetical protein